MKSNPFVKPISSCLPKNDGTKTLLATFGENLYLGEGCWHLGDYISLSTEPVEESIGELVQDGTSEQVFCGFGVELRKISHTPAQVCDLAGLLQLPNASSSWR